MKFYLNSSSKRGWEIMQMTHNNSKKGQLQQLSLKINIFGFHFPFFFTCTRTDIRYFKPEFLEIYMLGWSEGNLVCRIQVPSRSATNTRRP